MKKTITIIAAGLGLFLLTACSAAAPTSTPTPDLDPFRTEVAATVFAQVTQALAQTPSVTPVPSPTATENASPTVTQTPSATPPTDTTETVSAGGTPGDSTANRAEWVSQSVADGTLFTPGESFTMVWNLRNAGTATWSPAYLFRFYSGNAFGAPDEVLLGQEVAPGETVEISIAMTAPNTPGEYRSDWVMADEASSNFNEPVFLEITVVLPATATPTVANTATTAATATATP